MLKDWGIPSVAHLMRALTELAARQRSAKLALEAVACGVFTDPDSRTDSLQGIRHPPEQLALLAWMARHCQSTLSLEVGFGMGMTASIILAARTDSGELFNHLIVDPFGLPNRRGEVVQDFLVTEFGDAMHRLYQRSHTAMGRLIGNIDPPGCGLVFIDGDHLFEGVMTDFYSADKLLMIGGYMVFDDAAFPAVETVINYVRSNRRDYEICFLEIPNTAVLKKVGSDERTWDEFKPFSVPQRRDWTHINQS